MLLNLQSRTLACASRWRRWREDFRHLSPRETFRHLNPQTTSTSTPTPPTNHHRHHHHPHNAALLRDLRENDAAEAGFADDPCSAAERPAGRLDAAGDYGSVRSPSGSESQRARRAHRTAAGGGVGHSSDGIHGGASRKRRRTGGRELLAPPVAKPQPLAVKRSLRVTLRRRPLAKGRVVRRPLRANARRSVSS